MVEWRVGVLGLAIVLFVWLVVLEGHNYDRPFWTWLLLFSLGQFLWRVRSSRGFDGHAGSGSPSEPQTPARFDPALMERVRFDATGWSFVGKDATTWRWCDEVGNVLGLQVLKGQLGPMEQDTDVVSYCRDNIGFDRSLVEARPMQSPSFRGLTFIEKRERPPGYAYLGRLHVILEEQTVVVWTVAVERGETGVREASVAADALKKGRISIPANAPSGARVPGWFADPYDPARSERTICSIADEQQFDAKFPGHPLSRIRRTLRQIEASFKIHNQVRNPGDPWPHPPLSITADKPATIH